MGWKGVARRGLDGVGVEITSLISIKECESVLLSNPPPPPYHGVECAAMFAPHPPAADSFFFHPSRFESQFNHPRVSRSLYLLSRTVPRRALSSELRKHISYVLPRSLSSRFSALRESLLSTPSSLPPPPSLPPAATGASGVRTCRASVCATWKKIKFTARPAAR